MSYESNLVCGIFLFINQVLLEHRHLSICISAFVSYRQSWTVEAEPLWPMKQAILILWSSAGKLCQMDWSWLWSFISQRSVWPIYIPRASTLPTFFLHFLQAIFNSWKLGLSLIEFSVTLRNLHRKVYKEQNIFKYVYMEMKSWLLNSSGKYFLFPCTGY